jgi:uncharacterized protein (TIRG00374 family)
MALLGLSAGAAWAVYADRATIAEGSQSLVHLTPPWAGTAAAAQVVSMLAFALQEQRLFRALGGRLTIGRLLSTAYLANAINFAVPIVGSGMATRYAYRQFRLGGIDRSTATITLTLSGVVSTIAFAVVIVIAAVISGSPTAAAGSLLAAVAATVTVAAVLRSARSPRGRDRLADLADATLRVFRHIVRRPGSNPQATFRTAVERLGTLRLPFAPVASSLGFALLNWLADALCLVFAIKAVAAPVPVHQVLLVWSAGLGAQSFSPTPGGIGTVEVTMIAALVAVGLHPPEAVAAVVLYRVINSKLLVALGALLVQTIHRRITDPNTSPNRQEAAR